MIFDVAYVISELSKGMTLRAGTIIATGTPAGVGMGFDPPKYLESGDVIRCEIDGIGVLENKVK
jgi:2-keto-4-pentenoate hydratase/2-oxohepta-3-ene-1,7-dioic acid hydratase in catechol pathway